MRGFYWLIEGLLAGCPRPGGRGGGNPFAREKDAHSEEADRLDDDLLWLNQQGIGAVLSLTETQLNAEALARHDLAVLHLPVPDLTPPTTAQLVRALEFIDEQHALGRAVVVHCLMGQGRTGTVLTAYLIRSGASPAEALRTVRAVCTGAVEAPSQERALYAFAERRDWIV
ncbi:MAG TPA: dual specificity protein phosphatase family protein [Ktedonobacterales bacterium]